MHNFEEGISVANEWRSFKVNEVEFEVIEGKEITVPLSLFRVASWWIPNQKVPLLQTGPRFDRVPYVELTTPSLVKAGHHRVTVHSIIYRGKWISLERLMMILVAAWFTFGVCRVLVELWDYRVNLTTTKLRVAHLVTLLRAKREQEQERNAEKSPGSANKGGDLGEKGEETRSESPALQKSGYLRWISATVGNSVRMIMVDDIVYFQADHKYTRVVTATSEVLIKKSLKELLEELDPDQFWKTHRSIVVNALEIASIEPSFKGELTIKLKSRPNQLPVSEAFMRKFRKRTDPHRPYQ
jgi:hypothetical protein